MRLIFYFFFILFFSTIIHANNVLHIKIDDAISPASSKYLKDAFKETSKQTTKLMIIELNTPGGLLSSTREMIQDILNSKIPIVVYVSPKGARAASAGTFITYAANIAVMAPGTNIGAATPVNLMQMPKINDNKNQEIKNIKSSMEKKVLNDTSAFIKSIAELRKRNIDWALDAVKEGKSISANEALKINVIDFIAEDINELIKKIDGKIVKIDNKDIKIDLKNANIIFFSASWKTKFLMTISNPNIAYIFLILAIYGILFEMLNPGSIFPGVVGVTSALIALYSLNILPFNYVGLLLIILGISLMIMELFVSGLGIMGIAGVIAFAFGSIMLFDEKTLGEGVSLPLVIAFSIISLAFFIYLLGYLIKSRNNKLINGLNTMIGLKAKVIEVNNDDYKILCNGELWSAKSSEKFNINDDVEIKKIVGLIAQIRSIK